MLSSFGERASSCRNLADQSRQREAEIPTSWWKLISVPVSPDLMVAHILPSSRGMGLERAQNLFLQNQCLISHDSDRI